jgi:hypothetical protein
MRCSVNRGCVVIMDWYSSIGYQAGASALGAVYGAACVGAIWTSPLVESALSSSAATTGEEGC